MGRRALGRGISLHGGPAGEPGRGSFTGDLCVEGGSGDGHVSIGAPLRTWGEGVGVHLLGTLRDSWRALKIEHLTLWELC